MGQLSELFPEFLDLIDEVSIKNWKDWYVNKYPDAIEHATTKIFLQIKNLQEAIKLIDRNLIKKWVEDLVIVKTYNGLYVQYAVLAALAEKLNLSFRLAEPDEESAGIDGFVGDIPYSIKPDTYKTMDRLSESINVTKIFYKKTKTGLTVEVEE